MERIRFGQITAPVGIKGEIRVYPYLEQTRFSAFGELCVGDLPPVKVEKIRPDKNLLVIKLAGTDDRNAAEALRGKYLYLPKGVKPDLGERTYYVEDLVGCEVLREDGSRAGMLTQVISRSVQDLYAVKKDDGSSFLLPAVKELIMSVDTEKRVITARIPEGLENL